jgi:hypothetical protein
MKESGFRFGEEMLRNAQRPGYFEMVAAQDLKMPPSPFFSHLLLLAPHLFRSSHVFIPYYPSSVLLPCTDSLACLLVAILRPVFESPSKLITVSAIMGQTSNPVTDLLRVAIPVGVGIASAFYLKVAIPKLMGISGFSKDKVTE